MSPGHGLGLQHGSFENLVLHWCARRPGLLFRIMDFQPLFELS